MRRLIFLLALSALFAFGGTRDGSSAPLRIYTEYDKTPPSAVEGALRLELGRLVSPIGLNTEWKSLSDPRSGDSAPALVVISFKGRCDTVSLEPRRSSPGALAWTHISDGQILPFIDVDCEKTRQFLQLGLLRFDGGLRDGILGRALARLVAHEMYHVFAETTHHGKEGVAEPSCTATELLSDDFRFAEPQFRTLRSSRLRSILSLARPALSRGISRGLAEYAANGCASCHGPAGEGTKAAPAVAGRAKTLDPKVLISHFEKKSEEMYRRALTLRLNWYFPSDDEIREIAAVLATGLE